MNGESVVFTRELKKFFDTVSSLGLISQGSLLWPGASFICHFAGLNDACGQRLVAAPSFSLLAIVCKISLADGSFMVPVMEDFRWNMSQGDVRTVTFMPLAPLAAAAGPISNMTGWPSMSFLSQLSLSVFKPALSMSDHLRHACEQI